MSDYCRMKVLRIPIDEITENALLQKYNIDSLWELENVVEYFGNGWNANKFNLAPTENNYIDYILECGDVDGEYGKTRALSEKEKAKYGPKFLDIWDGFNVDDIRLVDFCWYDCTEAPDYYAEENDSFYDEV